MINKTTVVSIGLVALALPALAGAAKVAIAPVSYEQIGATDAPKEAAAKVEDKIAEGAREAGYEVLRGAVVADALGATAECAERRDRGCLEAVAERLGVDEVIAVSVADEDHASYRVELTHARRDKVVDERTAGFFVVLEWLRGTIALTLQKPAPEPAAQAQPVAAPEPSASDASARPDGSDDSGENPTPSTGRRKLRPAYFWTGVGLTGALAIAWAAVDIAAWKAPIDTGEERDAVHRMQVADGVLLGCGLGAAVATTVIFFFTDFEKKSGAERSAPSPSTEGGGGISTALAPFALPNGGGLVLEGRF